MTPPEQRSCHPWQLMLPVVGANGSNSDCAGGPPALTPRSGSSSSSSNESGVLSPMTSASDDELSGRLPPLVASGSEGEPPSGTSSGSEGEPPPVVTTATETNNASEPHRPHADTISEVPVWVQLRALRGWAWFANMLLKRARESGSMRGASCKQRPGGEGRRGEKGCSSSSSSSSRCSGSSSSSSRCSGSGSNSSSSRRSGSRGSSSSCGDEQRQL